ncbi:YcaO-like family protein [Prosthecomicrobium sp. N25]|uniref:YcaO-like family protein n=1 Tax=Prosthecomicrobium sp. N25 TaxID=3129254 RepID=UPI003078437F
MRADQGSTGEQAGNPKTGGSPTGWFRATYRSLRIHREFSVRHGRIAAKRVRLYACRAAPEPHGRPAALMIEPIPLAAVPGMLDGAAVRLAAVAGHLEDLFRIVPPAAPQAWFFGARLRPGPGVPAFGVAGLGTSPAEALAKCLGEAVEVASLFERGDEALSDELASRLPDAGLGADVAPPARLWAAVRREPDGAPFRIPLALRVRTCPPDRHGVPSAPLGLGTGAGPTAGDALRHGLLELIERDAVALWWRAGRPARRLAADAVEATAAFAELAALRGTMPHRPVTVVDLATDLPVTALAVFSTGPDGRGFAFGAAARPTFAEALRASLLELLQMELAQDLAAWKADTLGDGTLTDLDRRHLARRQGPPPAELPQVAAMPRADIGPDEDLAGKTLPASATEILEGCATMGHTIYSADCTRADLQLPVIRVYGPEMQPEPCRIVKFRMVSWRARTGFTWDSPLF